METDLEFLTLVARMRFFQQQYYRSRSIFTLDQCRKYESLVDAKLDVISNEMAIEDPAAHKSFITITIKSKA
jgi:hypothetical protein